MAQLSDCPWLPDAALFWPDWPPCSGDGHRHTRTTPARAADTDTCQSVDGFLGARARRKLRARSPFGCPWSHPQYLGGVVVRFFPLFALEVGWLHSRHNCPGLEIATEPAHSTAQHLTQAHRHDIHITYIHGHTHPHTHQLATPPHPRPMQCSQSRQVLWDGWQFVGTWAVPNDSPVDSPVWEWSHPVCACSGHPWLAARIRQAL